MKFMSRRLIASGIVSVGLGFAAASDASSATECGTSDTLTVAQMSWFSGGVMAYVTQKILADGFGCKVQIEPGDTVPTASLMLTRGEPDIAPEMWPSLLPDVWPKILASGKYYVANKLYPGGAVLGWWIPDYVAKEHPNLKSITDLRDNWKLFVEPGDQDKGRLYNGPPGWGGSVVTANLFKALGLEQTFELFSAGSGGNLIAAIARKVAQKKPIVAFYWNPTADISRYKLVELGTPPYDAKTYPCLADPNCANPQVSGWKPSEIVVAVATPMKKKAPAVAEYLAKMQIPDATIEKVLAWGSENSASLEDTANYFFKTFPDVWTEWIPADVAKAVKASLK